MVDYRLYTPADVDACVEVFYAADEALTASFNLPAMPRNPDNLRRMFVHLHETTTGLAWLARDRDEVVGFGMSARRSDLVFLALLFVLPDHQARGIGRALYELCVPRSGRRATCIWSIQPVSASLYAGDGLVPRVPMYTLIGRPRHALPELPRGLALTAVETAEIDELDAEVLGLSRLADHQVWKAWDRQAFALRGGSALLGYGYVQASGRVGPVVVRREEDLLPFVGALMARFDPPGEWIVHVPGPAAATLTELLRAGLKFDGAPTIYCATDDRVDHSRYLPGSFALP